MPKNSKLIEHKKSNKHKSNAKFKIESDLLKELGERLVSSSDVAMTELVKNSYDADSTRCELELGKGYLLIKDNGHGMTEDEFKSNWMTVATSNKLLKRESRKFSRQVTGSKGIGRFAVRFLGSKLKLETIAFDKGKKCKTKLIANFDWQALDKKKSLLDLDIAYEVITDVAESEGTTLSITDLKHDIDSVSLKKVRSGSLDIESPLYNLINEAPENLKDLKGSPGRLDKGFNLIISLDIEEEKSKNTLSNIILKNSIFDVYGVIKGEKFNVIINHFERGEVFKKSFKLKNNLNTDSFIRLYWFPKRSGVFQGKEFNGLDAWSWVKEHSGVAIFDSGFRVRPYAYEASDWLQLDSDGNKRNRHWRSTLAQREFAMSQEVRSSEKLNPMLVLPRSYQVVGSVFVSTNPTADTDALSPNMDRQGFTENESFKILKDCVRFCAEAIAHFDKKIQLEEEENERKRNRLAVKKEIKSVIKDINSSQSLNADDKKKLVDHYKHVSSEVKNLEEYDRRSRESLEAMSLLGVVAGFMTHEFEAALMQLERAQKKIKQLSKKDPTLQTSATEIDKSIEYFSGYVSYTRNYVDGLQSPRKSEPVKVLPAINYVIGTFSRFQEDRKIEVSTKDIEKNIEGPAISLPIYHGIFHNLYTNALKAVLNEKGKNPKVRVLAWNDIKKKKHYLKVMDNGVGIPDGSRSRIWDPMFTTTSGQDNPLGSGMGLGLPLVRKVIESQKGKVNLVEPPENYSTCFEVELPID